MGLLNALASGLGGAASSMADSYGKRNVAIDNDRLAAERQRLDIERARTVEAMREEFAMRGEARQREAGVKQGSEIDAEARRMQNERDAAAINAKEGSSMSAADAEVLRNNPEARKAYGLLDSSRKSDLEDRGTAAEKLGYLDAAKETRGMLQTEVANQRNADNDKNANRRLDLQEAYQQRREARMDRLAESQLSFQKSRADKEDARSEGMAVKEQRAATAAALRGVNDDIKSLEKEAADPMLAPEQKTVITQQLQSARNEAARYRNALADAGLEGSAAKSPDKPFNPDDFRAKPSATSPAKAAPAPRPKADEPKQEEKRTRSAAEIRGGGIETREQFVSRGKFKTQFKNPKTGTWHDTREEAAKGLG